MTENLFDGYRKKLPDYIGRCSHSIFSGHSQARLLFVIQYITKFYLLLPRRAQALRFNRIRMERMRKEDSEREGKMYEQQATVGFDSIMNTFRLCFAEEQLGEIGYCPLKLGVKTIGVRAGFYHELLNNSCRVKVSAPNLLGYLWSTRNKVEFSIFSQN